MRLLLMLVLMMLAMFLRVESATAQSALGSSEEIRFETAKSMSLSPETARWEFGPPLKLSGTLTLPPGSGPSGRAGAWLWWDHTRANEVGARPK